MKSILVPVDFSEVSDNALNYAINLAKYVTADLILLNVVPIPAITTEYNVVTYPIDEIMKANLDTLKQKSITIKKENNFNGQINYFVEMGDVETNIAEYITKHKIEFIVMGITGYDTKFGEVVFGSNAVRVCRKSNVPVFIIPKNFKFSKIKKIAFASAYENAKGNENNLITIKYINTIFGANLDVVHVIKENHLMDSAEADVDLFVEEKLENTNHKTYILSKNKVSEALIGFIQKHQIDIIVIEQTEHSFLHRLIYPSQTKEVAFNSSIPVLSIKS